MKIDAPVRPRNSLPRSVAFGFRIFRFPPLQIKTDYRTDHTESEKQKRSRVEIRLGLLVRLKCNHSSLTSTRLLVTEKRPGWANPVWSSATEVSARKLEAIDGAEDGDSQTFRA